jgi:hypothetical protein
VGEHLLSAFEIGDDAADERSANGDVAALAAKHLARLEPECDDLVRHLVNGDERRFVEDDTAAFDGDDRARRAQVDRHRIGDQLF